MQTRDEQLSFSVTMNCVQRVLFSQTITEAHLGSHFQFCQSAKRLDVQSFEQRTSCGQHDVWHLFKLSGI